MKLDKREKAKSINQAALDLSKNRRYHYALGRRKRSSARVRLFANGSGQWLINGQPASQYLAASQPLLSELQQPFVATGQVDNFDVSVKVKGGGHHGQVGAIKFGLAKALVLADGDNKDSLRKAELLGRDPRAKERKKFGLRGARKKRQFTKR